MDPRPICKKISCAGSGNKLGHTYDVYLQNRCDIPCISINSWLSLLVEHF